RHITEATWTIARTGGIAAIPLADHAMRGEPVDQREVVGHPLVLQRDDGRKFRRLARGETDPQPRAAGLEQLEKRAATPDLGHLALARRTVFDQLGMARLALAAPAGGTAFMDRMQRVDDHRGPG